VILMLLAVAAVVGAAVYIGRTLEPVQRVVLAVALILGFVYVVRKAMEMGLLGRHTG